MEEMGERTILTHLLDLHSATDNESQDVTSLCQYLYTTELRSGLGPHLKSAMGIVNHPYYSILSDRGFNPLIA